MLEILHVRVVPPSLLPLPLQLMLPFPPALSSSLFLYPSAHSDFPVGLCDMTELDIGEDAVSWYNKVKLQLPASEPLTDLSHQEGENAGVSNVFLMPAGKFLIIPENFILRYCLFLQLLS